MYKHSPIQTSFKYKNNVSVDCNAKVSNFYSSATSDLRPYCADIITYERAAYGYGHCPITPLHNRLHFIHSLKPKKYQLHIGLHFLQLAFESGGNK